MIGNYFPCFSFVWVSPRVLLALSKKAGRTPDREQLGSNFKLMLAARVTAPCLSKDFCNSEQTEHTKGLSHLCLFFYQPLSSALLR